MFTVHEVARHLLSKKDMEVKSAESMCAIVAVACLQMRKADTVTTEKNEELNKLVGKTAAEVVNILGYKVRRIYRERRVSQDKCNIAGRQCKLFVNYADDAVVRAVQAVVASFGCTAVLHTILKPWAKFHYIKILRNS